MAKFWTLLKKEIRDILSPQTIIPIVIIVVLFLVMGSFMSGIIEEAGGPTEGAEVTAKNTIAIIDIEKTESSNYFIEAFKSIGYNILIPNTNDPAEAYNIHKNEFEVLMVLPEGFGDILSGKGEESAVIDIYSDIKSFSLMTMIGGMAINEIVNSISSSISQSLIRENLVPGAPDFAFLYNPISTVEYTRVNDKIEQVPGMFVVNMVSSQTVFIPLVIFVIIIFSANTLAASVTGEKADKTLETLLTTPVKRINILIAKIVGASLISIAYAVVFMLSMGGMMGGMGEFDVSDTVNMTEIMENLGISFNATAYIVLGISLFLSIIIGLAFAILTGILAEDLKKLNGLIMPMMILLMVPYLISMFVDINTLPMAFRIIMYIIPFTHTFTAVGNLFTSNFLLLGIGLGYQLIFLIFSVIFVTRIFGSDKIFTLKVNFGMKKKSKEVKE
ncbi:MAG: ABC transporter permease [Oscillospiraceae bacterium]|nr:ABC transporter permease [Oscillospiraceae bacterium]